MKRSFHQIISLQPEQIEDVIHQMSIGFASPLLERVEIGFALGIDYDDFPVYDGVDPPLLKSLLKRIEFLVEVFVISRPDVNRSVVEVADGAISIPFDLIKPAVIIKRLIDQRCKHRLDVRGETFFLFVAYIVKQ